MVPGTGSEARPFALLNGSIFTGKGFEKGHLVIREGSIELVGFGEGRPHGLGDADIHECRGSRVIPALFDAHMHLFEWGIGRLGIDLTGASSSEEIFSSLDRVFEGTVENEMFSGSGLLWGIDYDDSGFRSPFKTTANELDKRYGGQPVLIKRVDGHLAFSSSSFMERTEGLSAKAPNGRLDDTTGLASVHDIPLDTIAAGVAYRKAREMLWSLGVAGGLEITSLDRFPLFQGAFGDEGGGLKLSMSLIADLKGEPREQNLGRAEKLARSAIGRSGKGSLPVFFLKAFADGSIGARTASFSVPFTDGSSAEPSMSAKDVADFASDCESLGLLPMLHAIGDRALDSVISGMEKQGGIARVEHLEYVRTDQTERMARSRIIACMQPNFQARWGLKDGLYESRLGPLYRGLNNYARVASSGTPLCFGTDMMPPGPIGSFSGAIRHPDPASRIPLHETIKNYSARAIRCSFIMHGSGKLLRGAPADILVLDEDGSPAMLFIDGKNVFNADKR